MPPENPFDLDQPDAYSRWRDQRLEQYPLRIEELLVEIKDPQQLQAAEHAALLDRIQRANMAIYVSSLSESEDKLALRALSAQFGLNEVWLDPNQLADEDGFTSLTVRDDDPTRSRYIPYTNRTIHWHTDGYYNEDARQIHALNLHCVRPAHEGGENALLDHELAYILLRDENPEHIRALSAPDVMTIPGNQKDGFQRPDRSGPVFSVHEHAGQLRLHMRYTARLHNIVWKQELQVIEALQALSRILDREQSPWVFRATLHSGMGLLSNNVLHDRTGFVDDPAHPRLLYRARFYDRIQGS
jgi:hypothetical protein